MWLKVYLPLSHVKDIFTTLRLAHETVYHHFVCEPKLSSQLSKVLLLAA